MERVGEASYVVEFGPGDRLDVHHDQLKLYHANEPVGDGVPLVYHVDYAREKGPTPAKIRAHRVSGGRKLELLVHWEGTTSAQDSWEPLESFIQVKGAGVLQYCKDQGLGVDLERLGEAL